ncbi:MAG: hypothetical protein IJ366_01945 [Clostridia bacterium]|nr:hypothetical protein [Clostridia bacterium]
MKRLEKWLTTGAFICEVSELGSGYYIDNYSFAYDKYVPFFEELKKRCETVKCTEGEIMTCFGREHKWRVQLLGERESRLEWNTIGRRGVLMNVFAATEINAPCDGEYEFTVSVKGSAAISVNGQSFATELKLGAAEQTLNIKARLKKGRNTFCAAVMNMHIHCSCAFGVETEDRIELCEDISRKTTEEIRKCEEELSRFYLPKSVFIGDEPICVEFEEDGFSGGEYVFSVYAYDGFDETMLRLAQTVRFDGIKANGRLELFSASKLKSGRYIIKTECDGIEGESHSFSRRERVSLPENYTFEQRRSFLLDYYSEQGVVLAALEKNGAVDEQYIEERLCEVNGRYDCADFSMHELLRIYGKYRSKLSKPLAEKIKKAILGFKYRADESGETMMFVRSENHQMSFFSCEYVAGILFPNEIFTNSGQNGLFHAFKGRYDCEQWIREKGRYGFCEWYSNAYLPHDIISLVDIYDFADADPDLKYMAKNLLDFIALLIATHSSKGVMGCVHGRCYEHALKNPDDEGLSHLMWLLYGTPSETYDEINKAAAAVASSSYTPRPITEAAATTQEPIETYSRMGIFRYDGRLGVNIYCYRKKDYILSGLLESRKGEFGTQVQAGQLLLDGTAPVFVTCFESMKSNTRPSYWSGQYSIPKTDAYKNLLVHIYRLGGRGYTHCYFPEEKFDSIVRNNGWKFGKTNDAYTGVYSSGGYTETMRGSYKGRELLCDARETVWLLAAGDKEEYGSFEGFIKAICDGTMSEKNGAFILQSKAFGEVKLSWDGDCTINGKPFSDGELPLISNRFAYSEYGDGYIRLNEEGDRNYIIF